MLGTDETAKKCKDDDCVHGESVLRVYATIQRSLEGDAPDIGTIVLACATRRL